jgi:hypothetical protein
MKTCKKCEFEKDDSEFAKEKRSKDGLKGTCKQCSNILLRQ